jgi:hypothetical protein
MSTLLEEMRVNIPEKASFLADKYKNVNISPEVHKKIFDTLAEGEK